MRLFRPSEGDDMASERTKSWARTGSLDNSSQMKNGKDKELNGEEDVSRHSNDITKAADEELRREGMGYRTGTACSHLSTTGGFYTK